MCPLSNASSLIKIGFSKKELCQISQYDLIIYVFSIENLYEVQRVAISTFRPVNNTEKSTIHSLFCNFLQDFNLILRGCYENFPKVTYLGCNSGSYKNPKCLGSYIRKYIVQQDLKFGSELQQEFISNGF